MDDQDKDDTSQVGDSDHVEEPAPKEDRRDIIVKLAGIAGIPLLLGNEQILRLAKAAVQGDKKNEEKKRQASGSADGAPNGRCEGPGAYLCQEFECNGSIIDDFECDTFACLVVYHCIDSFDASDCGGPNKFTCSATVFDDDGPG